MPAARLTAPLLALLLALSVPAVAAADAHPRAHPHHRHRAHHHKRHHHKRHHHRAHRAASCTDTDLEPAAGNLGAIQDAVLCLLNRERADRGLRALGADARLTEASAEHSYDMVRRRYFEHVTPNGRDVVDRLRAVGYIPAARAWHVGENIAWGTGDLGTPAKIVDAWMHSPGHRANILDGDYREIGVGIAVGNPQTGAGGATYTTDFGRVG